MTIEQLIYCVSVDIETTGTDEKRHGIVSIGAKTYVGGHTFYRELIIPNDCEYDKDAMRVNGETVEELKARKEPEFIQPIHAIVELLNWCNQHKVGVIIGKNPNFDHRFLKYSWVKYGLDADAFIKVLTYRTIDWADMIIPLMLWHGMVIPREGLGNIDLSRFMSMPDEPQPHIASVGAAHNISNVKRILDMYAGTSDEPNKD